MSTDLKNLKGLVASSVSKVDLNDSIVRIKAEISELYENIS